MPGIEKRTISLPAAQASYIDALVEAGTYASASEVVRAGLRALRERDAAVERWLREEVAPVYDAMQADPRRGLSADQVTAALAAHPAARLKKTGRAASGAERARNYTDRIVATCRNLVTFPERGTPRDDLRPGLRTTTYRRRATIAFHITATQVVIDLGRWWPVDRPKKMPMGHLYG